MEDMEDKVFIEKAFYAEPPNLLSTATEEEIKIAWDKWLKENKQGRANHKRAWTKAQKPGRLPNFDTGNTMVKIHGVWKQRSGMIGFVGDAELRTLETVLVQRADQDKHFQARGKRADRRGNRHKGRRNNPNKKELKRQSILNQKTGKVS